MADAGPPLLGRIAALALPALGVLAAEPLYLLFDTAVVGRLGALSLAGLAVGGLVVAMVSTQLTFCPTERPRGRPDSTARAIAALPYGKESRPPGWRWGWGC